MEKWGKYIQIPANIMLIVAVVFTVLALVMPNMAKEAYTGDFLTERFNENWVLIEESQKRTIELPAVIPEIQGTVVQLENTLPADVKEGMRLCMRTSYQDIFYYIDGELRGSYVADERLKLNHFPPGSYVMLDLTEEDAGKTIRIELDVKYKGRLNEVTIGYGNNVWFEVLANNLPVTVSAIILCIIGVLAVGMALVLMKLSKTGKSLLFLGQTMVIVGMWIVSESQLRQILFQSPYYSGLLAFVLVELVGGFVALYFNEVQGHYYNKVYVIIETVVFSQVAVNTVLAATGIATLYSTLKFSHIWLFGGVIAAAITVIMDIKTQRIKNYLSIAIGMLVFIIFCIFEFIGYYFEDFFILGMYLCIGLVVLLAATVIQTVRDEIQKVKEKAEMERFQSILENTVEEQTVELQKQQKKVKEQFVQTVTALSEAVDAKDRYTSGHSKRVAMYARMIAERMGKNREEQEIIYRAGLLHDVGKIRIPAEIINKPGELTDEEYNIIKIHPVTGYHILRGISDDNYIADTAKYHHERYDGKGYPNGLSGEDIPESARILGVADSYDTMTSNRSYRGALPQHVVREEIEKGRGTQFDPKIADIMLQMIDEDRKYTLKQADITKKYILSVDDDEMNNMIIKRIMRDEPMYEIVSANSGKEALELLSTQSFDLILLDAMMPEMSGYETMQRIREKYRTPVVLMTSDKSNDFAEFGCDDYITKPVLPLLVREIVHTMTERIKMEE